MYDIYYKYKEFLQKLIYIDVNITRIEIIVHFLDFDLLNYFNINYFSPYLHKYYVWISTPSMYF